MTPLLIVVPYHAKDATLARNLLSWIGDFSAHDKNYHSCLLVADSAVGEEEQRNMALLAKQCFGFTARITASGAPGFAPNQMFLAAAKWIYQCGRLPWLWLEPDCVPLKASWLDVIADEYSTSPMRFMGAFVRQDKDEKLPKVHLTGCSIYPSDAYPIYDAMPNLRTASVAWDIESAGAVIPRARESKLVQHYYGTRELPPTFVARRTANSPENQLDLHFLKPEAVLFHRCKDTSLIELLRKAK